MRIGLAQINPTLGQFKKNSQTVLEFVHRAHARHCDLLVFPEATIFGYHPFDLLERKVLAEQQIRELKTIQQKLPQGFGIILGMITKNDEPRGRPYRNSAVLLEKGKKPRWFHKMLLPTGDVFDEARFIEPGTLDQNYFSFGGKKFYLTICEDIWAWPEAKKRNFYHVNPLEKVPKQKVDCVLNISASPFYHGKIKVREKLVKHTAKHFKAPMVYCNLVGAQDEIIFDGKSFVSDSRGKKILALRAFEEDLGIFHLESLQREMPPFEVRDDSEIEEIRQALVLGIRDFCAKTKNTKVHFGLSGGIDSAVVACLAVDALGADNVHAIALPTKFNSRESLKLAQKLAKNLEVELTTIPIQKSFELLREEVDRSFDVDKFGLVHENLQSRIRGLFLMAYSNQNQSLLLGTTNKSELAAGYGTLYGDLIGALMPLGDLTKHQVVKLGLLYNAEMELIPNKIITRPPTAELRKGQLDSQSLPDYKLLDQSVDNLVTYCKPVQTPTDRWLSKKIYASEFKRWQAPPILKVSVHSFGRGRRWPVAHQASEA